MKSPPLTLPYISISPCSSCLNLIGSSTESHIEGDGPSESETAEKHMKDAILHGVKVNKFYGDGAFDTNDLFDLTHSIGARPVIKIRKNAYTEYSRGSRHRRRTIRIYKEKGYDRWAHENSYGMRWPCTEGIFSAVKKVRRELCEQIKEGPGGREIPEIMGL